MKLNIGSGNVVKEGYTNIDLYICRKGDIKWNLFNGLPPEVETSTVEHIIASHIFEHIPETYYMFNKRMQELVEIKSRIKLMDDCYRVLENGGQLEIWTPHRYDPCMYTDPTHVWYMDMDTLDQFCVNPNDESKLYFEDYIKDYEYDLGKKYSGRFKKVLCEGINHADNPYYMQPIPTQIHWVLEAIKE